MNKKGSLSLSINAIVVIVIAFVVLGLGLTLTRTIFKQAEGKLPEAFAVTQLEAEPTSENPITLSQTVDIGREDVITKTIGYYNRKENTAVGAIFTITSCLDPKTGSRVDSTLVPSVASEPQNVDPSGSAGYSIVLTENGLTAGQYICTMAVCSTTACAGADQPYENKQFFLRVIA
ncbi:MAG TPA: hypothetical protein VJI15_06355 [Candidatus Nanoarchaeia archaeon]|nr:hypothetical protein [Candidatus Nanoarchaeia archaeon]